MSSYDQETALVVVDVQNDFAEPDGSLFVPGATELIPALNAEIVRALSQHAPVVYTADWHPESTPHFAKDGGIWPVHCVADTWGAAFHPRLLLAGPSIRKGVGGEDGYSGFTVADPHTGETTPTGLAELLERLGVRAIVVVGLALDYCVKATALDGVSAGLDVTLPTSLTAPVEIEAGDGARAIEACRAAGVRVT